MVQMLQSNSCSICWHFSSRALWILNMVHVQKCPLWAHFKLPYWLHPNNPTQPLAKMDHSNNPAYEVCQQRTRIDLSNNPAYEQRARLDTSNNPTHTCEACHQRRQLARIDTSDNPAYGQRARIDLSNNPAYEVRQQNVVCEVCQLSHMLGEQEPEYMYIMDDDPFYVMIEDQDWCPTSVNTQYCSSSYIVHILPVKCSCVHLLRWMHSDRQKYI